MGKRAAMQAVHLPSSTVLRAPLVLASLGVLAFAAGCKADRPAQEPATASAESAASDAEPVAERALPQPGQSLVWIHRGAVTVLANRAPRLQVLRDLAREGRFELEIGADAQASGAVTLRAEEVSLERALARLLKDVPYTLHYAVDAESEEATLTRLALGETNAKVGLAKTVERREQKSQGPAPKTGREVGSREREREPDTTAYDARQAETLRQLEDRSTEVRVEAAEVVYPDAHGIEALAARLTDDPEPRVRVAAAESLGYSVEDPEALGALLRALHDPEPEVVITALDAIEFVGDHTVILELGFLLGHPDAEVREATAEAIWWLED